MNMHITFLLPLLQQQFECCCTNRKVIRNDIISPLLVVRGLRREEQVQRDQQEEDEPNLGWTGEREREDKANVNFCRNTGSSQKKFLWLLNMFLPATTRATHDHGNIPTIRDMYATNTFILRLSKLMR